MRDTFLPRALAAIIAALAWLSFLRTFYDYSFGLEALRYGAIMTSLFYTHWATLIVAIIFSAIAVGLRRWAAPDVVGHTVIIMGILVGHYWFFQGLGNFLISPLRSKIVHGILPALIVIYWVAFIERRKLRRAHPLYWTAFPLLYTVYALGRGAVTGEYAYDVGNPDKLGYMRVIGLVALTILLSLAAGYGVLGADRISARLVESMRRSGLQAPLSVLG